MMVRPMVSVAVGCALSFSLVVAPTADAARKGDPLLPKQWGMAQVHATKAWSRATGKGVIVAVIDSGVDATHPDLRRKVLPGLDLVHQTRNAWTDVEGHGTGVAGVIAAARGNGLGIAGIAPDVRILPVKDGDYQPDGNLMPIAIRWAADHGAAVINVSQGTLPVLDAVDPVVLAADMQAAIDHAWAKEAVIVVAAGNNYEPICSSPASLRHVLCVGAVDKRQLKPAFSSFDAAMSTDYLVAPGGSDDPIGFDSPAAAGNLGNDEHIWTTAVPGTGTVVNDQYWTQVRGTSFAAPFVAGVAALLAQRGLTNSQIVRRILSTTTDLGAPGRDPLYGYGEVDAARAVGLAP